MVWKGVIIEESLEGRDLLDIVKVVATKRNTLKKEPEKGVLIFHMVELDDQRKDENDARNYGISAGIIKEQMPFEKLIENPYG